MHLSQTENQVAEILVRGKQQGVRIVCFLQDSVIKQTRLQFRDGDDIVAVLPESVYDRLIDALVRKEIHVPVCRVG